MVNAIQEEIISAWKIGTGIKEGVTSLLYGQAGGSRSSPHAEKRLGAGAGCLGVWVSGLVKHRTLGLGTGHHLVVSETVLASGSSSLLTVPMNLLGILSPSLSAPSPLILYLSLSKMNKKKKERKKERKKEEKRKKKRREIRPETPAETKGHSPA